MSNRNPFLGDLVRPLSQLLTRLHVFSAGTRAERLATTRFMLFHHQRIFPLKNLSAFMRRLIAAHLSSPTQKPVRFESWVNDRKCFHPFVACLVTSHCQRKRRC